MVWTRYVSGVHSEGYKVHETVSYGRYINDGHTTPCSGMLGHRKTQELKLGDAQGIPSYISRSLKQLSLGMPRQASHLSSSTTIGQFSLSLSVCFFT
jgi:hypothetical protein